jgi:hypothetical protein
VPPLYQRQRQWLRHLGLYRRPVRLPPQRPSVSASPVTTDVLRLTFDSEGGSLVRSEFLKHTDLADKNARFVLLDESPAASIWRRPGLIGGTGYPTHKTVMSFSGDDLKDGSNELVIKFESPEVGGVKLVKTYCSSAALRHVPCRHEVVNTGSAPVSPAAVPATGARRQQAGRRIAFYSTFTGPAAYTEAKKFQKVEFSDIEKNKAEFRKVVGQWLCGHGAALLCQRLVAGRRHQARAVHAQGGQQPLLGRHDHDAGPMWLRRQLQGGGCPPVRGPAGRKDCWKPSHLAWNWSRTTAG